MINSTGNASNHYLYRGEQFDSDFGLYYLRARYYNPVTGRFLTRDPEPGDPSDPVTLHKYLYARQDPVNWADPTGRLASEEYSEFLKRVVLSGAIISEVGLLAQEINCLYTYDASAIQGIAENAGSANIRIQRAGRCWANVTGTETASNEDFGKRKRAIRAFYAEHLTPEETEDCNEQWQEAIRFCTAELSKPSWKRNRGMTGNHDDIINCARGHVTEQCGGNMK